MLHYFLHLRNNSEVQILETKKEYKQQTIISSDLSDVLTNKGSILIFPDLYPETKLTGYSYFIFVLISRTDIKQLRGLQHLMKRVIGSINVYTTRVGVDSGVNITSPPQKIEKLVHKTITSPYYSITHQVYLLTVKLLKHGQSPTLYVKPILP